MPSKLEKVKNILSQMFMFDKVDDHYYIKTSEYFRDHIFKLTDGRRVHFKLAEADTETSNVNAAAGQERRFILYGNGPVPEEMRTFPFWKHKRRLCFY